MNDERSPIRHILVPHDFSETAERALGFALDLGQRLGARLSLLHAYEIVAYGFAEAPSMSEELAEQIESAARSALEAVQARARRSGLDVTAVLRRGSPWREIVAFAKESKADLVVMGTHGRRGLSRLLLGSVAERVIRTSPCPVLTVHGPESEP